MTNEEYITLLYRSLIGREPDDHGLAVYTAMLNKRVDLRDIVDLFVSGPEYSGGIKRQDHDFSFDTQLRVKTALKLIEPCSVIDHRKIRFGNGSDGGYVMLDDFSGIAAAYSIGISDDVSWDFDVAERGIAVFQYDHTIAHLPIHHDFFNFTRLGIAPVDALADHLISLKTALARNRHSSETELILKMDIEGAEWEVFSGCDADIIGQFRQIVIEFHGLNELCDPGRASLMQHALVKLTTHHNVVHVHGNNYAPWSLAGGIPIPTALEMTFVRKEGKRFSASNETFPTPLDRPNNQLKADYCLGNFRF